MAAASNAPNPATPTEGKRAPAFSLLDQHEQKVTLAGLEGRKVLVYFYPRADTPGCTTQACGLRDIAGRIGDTVVVGISPDAPTKLKKFDDKYGLGFTLLSDEDHAIAEKYGVWVLKKNYGKEYMGRPALRLPRRRGRQDRAGLAHDQPQGHTGEPARRARRVLSRRVAVRVTTVSGRRATAGHRDRGTPGH